MSDDEKATKAGPQHGQSCQDKMASQEVTQPDKLDCVVQGLWTHS